MECLMGHENSPSRIFTLTMRSATSARLDRRFWMATPYRSLMATGDLRTLVLKQSPNFSLKYDNQGLQVASLLMRLVGASEEKYVPSGPETHRVCHTRADAQCLVGSICDHVSTVRPNHYQPHSHSVPFLKQTSSP
jgi:hypothetical protein